MKAIVRIYNHISDNVQVQIGHEIMFPSYKPAESKYVIDSTISGAAVSIMGNSSAALSISFPAAVGSAATTAQNSIMSLTARQIAPPSGVTNAYTLFITTPSVTPSPTPYPTPGVTPSPTPYPTPGGASFNKKPLKKGLTSGQKTGIGIGVALAVILATCLLVYFLVFYKNPKNVKSQKKLFKQGKPQALTKVIGAKPARAGQ